jgi:hypothetical protein
MLNLPLHLTVIFIFTTLLAYLLLVWAVYKGTERTSKRTHLVLLLLMAWLIFQSTLSLNGWYMDRKAMPPHLAFPIVASIGAMALLFFTPRGRRFADGLSWEVMTWVHVVRLPIELCLYALALYKQVPWSMTFTGRNADVLFGITAPIIAIWGVRLKRLPMPVIFWWNVAGLLSVVHIAVTGIGAAPSPIQWWEFSQPNYAVMHFPFSWLPSFLVPLVVVAHIIGLRQSSRRSRS